MDIKEIKENNDGTFTVILDDGKEQVVSNQVGLDDLINEVLHKQTIDRLFLDSISYNKMAA